VTGEHGELMVMLAENNSLLAQQRYLGQVRGMDEGVRILPISI
jgi:hypothetical protein